MSSVSDVGVFKKRILDVIPEVIGAALQAGSGEIIARLDAVEHRLRENSTTVVVMGEFSRGKSSLLNALLEETDELLPVDSYVSTRVLTSVQWGEPEVITVSLAARGAEPAQQVEVSRAELRGYICEADIRDGEGAARADRVTAVSVGTPNPKLRDGLVLVDTPGIGGVDRGHTNVALGVLSQPEVDAVVYVTDVFQPLLASELAFIERVARAVDAEHHPERLLFAVTKADQVADPGEAVRDVRARVAAVPGLGEQAVVLPVSSRYRLLQVTGAVAEDDELAGFGPFEARLRADIAAVQLRVRLAGALAELDVAAQSLLEPVLQALAVLGERDGAARDRLAADAEDRRAEVRKLTEGAAMWPQDLQAAHAELAAELDRKSVV